MQTPAIAKIFGSFSQREKEVAFFLVLTTKDEAGHGQELMADLSMSIDKVTRQPSIAVTTNTVLFLIRAQRVLSWKEVLGMYGLSSHLSTVSGDNTYKDWVVGTPWVGPTAVSALCFAMTNMPS